MFNQDICSVLGYFFFVFNLLKYSYNSKSIFILVCSVQIVDVFSFSGDNEKVFLFVWFQVI